MNRVLLFSLLLLATCAARDLYVSPDGSNDTRICGTHPSIPCRSLSDIERFLDDTPISDARVRLMDGYYSGLENCGVDLSIVSIESFSPLPTFAPPRVILNCSRFLHPIFLNQSSLSISGIHFAGEGFTYPNVGRAIITNCMFSGNLFAVRNRPVFIENSTFHLPLVLAKSSFSIIRRCRFLHHGCVIYKCAHIRISDSLFTGAIVPLAVSRTNFVRIHRCHFLGNTGPVYFWKTMDVGLSHVVLRGNRVLSFRHAAPLEFRSCCDLVLHRCVFEGNRGIAGGGLFVRGVYNAQFLGVTFRDNNATLFGGALVLTESFRILLEGCEFVFNRALVEGGALFLQLSRRIAVRATQFVCNEAYSSGGAIYASLVYDLNATEVLFHANAATYGAATYMYHVAACTFDTGWAHRNLGRQDGALTLSMSRVLVRRFFITQTNGIGLVADTADPACVEHCVFYNNSAVDRDGGGIWSSHSRLHVTHCTFRRNFARRGGGAVAANSQSRVILEDSEFWSNRASVGGAVFLGQTFLMLRHSRFLSNRAWDGGALSILGSPSRPLERPPHAPPPPDLTGIAFSSPSPPPMMRRGHFHLFLPSGDGGRLSFPPIPISVPKFPPRGRHEHGGCLYPPLPLPPTPEFPWPPGASVRVEDSLFALNRAVHRGGALSFVSLAVRIARCHLLGNTADLGSAIEARVGASLSLVGLRVAHNQGTGAVLIRTGVSATMERCVVEANEASAEDEVFAGVAVLGTGSNATIRASTLQNNHGCALVVNGDDAIITTDTATRVLNNTLCNVECERGAIRLARNLTVPNFSGPQHSPWIVCSQRCRDIFPSGDPTPYKCSVPDFRLTSYSPKKEYVHHPIVLTFNGTNQFLEIHCKAQTTQGEVVVSAVEFHEQHVCTLPPVASPQRVVVLFSNDGGRSFAHIQPQDVVIEIKTNLIMLLIGQVTGLLAFTVGAICVCLVVLYVRWRRLRKRTRLELKSWEECEEEIRAFVDFTDLKILERIGHGGSGEVFRGVLHGSQVAVKRLYAHISERALAEFQREVSLMKTIRHPNVVLFIGATSSSPFILVSEFMSCGSLYDLLHSPTELSWDLRLLMALDAARGINYLHTLHPPLIHRDLKSPNLMVDELMVVKISDFGVSRLQDEACTMTLAGTPLWTAPEVSTGQRYGLAADVYSFGIVLWELVTRATPFQELGNPTRVIFEVVQGARPPIPETCPPELAALMQDCWQGDPAKRPTFEEIVARLAGLAPPPSIPRHTFVPDSRGRRENAPRVRALPVSDAFLIQGDGSATDKTPLLG